MTDIIEFDNKKIQQFRQSNSLINSIYNITLTEKRVLVVTISMIKPEDKDFKEYRIPINKFAELFKIKGNSVLELVKTATSKLLERKLIIEDGKKLIQMNWISSAKYEKDSSDVIVRFDPNLKDYLLDLKGGYTTALLSQVSQFSSIYSFRLYELFKQYYPKIKQREFKIVELKRNFGCENEYENYANFKVKVIKKAQEEINNLSDIWIEFKEKKKGKKVDSLIFEITPNKKNKHQPDESNDNQTLGLDSNKIIEVDLLSLPQIKSQVGEEIKEEIYDVESTKLFFNKNKYKSSPTEFFNHWTMRDWMDGKSKISNRKAAAEKWEIKFQQKNPDLYKVNPIKEKESEDIVALRDKIKKEVWGIWYDVHFLGRKIENNGVGGFNMFCITLEEKEKLQKLYQRILSKLNINLILDEKQI